jgi:anti-anti-sigma factor
MEMQMDCSDNGIVQLKGELNIQYAGELKELLLKACSEGKELSLDLGGVTEVDIACLQVLCSAHKTFLASNRELNLIGREAASFVRALDDSGYRRKTGCHSDPNRNCLWVVGGCHE